MVAAKKTAVSKIRSEAEKFTENVDAAAGVVKVKLLGRNGSALLAVQSVLDWGDDAFECLARQDMRGWARAALDSAAFEKWVECAPTIRQGLEFYAAWGDALGESPGESSAS